MIDPLIENGKATLKFELYGVTQEQAKRFKESLDVIISQGVLGIHDGKAVLSFDFEGTLREVSFDFKKWRRQSNKS